MTTDLSKYSIKEYNHGSIFKRISWFVLGNIFINSYLPIPQFFKKLILTLFGAKIGQGVVIKPNVNIKYPWLLTIKNHVWIGESVWIDNLTEVEIEDNVCLSQGAMLLTGNHDYKSTTFDLIVGKIKLEAGVWIGAKAIVCPGITCFSHAVLVAGSVASSDLEAYKIYRGNPAVFVKERKFVDTAL
jgi:putative colanic acid biosynthesis acetyltransferase WcaF